MTIPEIRLERLPAVLARRGTGPTHLYDAIAKGVWTPPIRMGRASCWPQHESQALLQAQIAGATDDQLRVLVRELIEQRKALMPAPREAA